MIGIMKKNITFFIQYIGFLYPLMVLYWFLRKDSFDLPAIMISGFFFYLLISGSVNILESYEFKNNVYHFFKTLPLNAGDIVRAKFYNVLIAVFFLFTANSVIYSIIIPDKNMQVFSYIFILCCMLLTLNIIAVLYIGFFSIGFNKMGKLLWITLILWLVLTILSVEMYLIKLDANLLYAFISRINRMVWVIVTFAGFASYYGLMRIAIRQLEQNYDNV
ncbi:ABC-2 transporter permease [candidate division KSB1 bacterium]|nr:ABC-2 transporter permease [candidate division KSB1 bacterium]